MNRIIHWSECQSAHSRTQVKRGWDFKSFCHLTGQPCEVDPNLPRNEAKESLGAVIPAVWKDGVTHRETKEISHYDILGIDVDNSSKVITGYNERGGAIIEESMVEKPLTYEILLEKLNQSGLAYLVYETFSGTAGWPKMRAFVPLSRSISQEELPHAVELMLDTIGIQEYRASMDLKTMRTPARIYFKPGKQVGQPQVWSNPEGEWLQVPEDVMSIPLPELVSMTVSPAAQQQWQALGLEERDPKDTSWIKEFGVDLKTLDLFGLVRSLGVEVKEEKPYGDGTKARCHCPWHSEHGGGRDDEGAWILERPGKWPIYTCDHTVHKDMLGLRDILEAAGVERVKQYADPWEGGDTPVVDYSNWAALGLPAPAAAPPALPVMKKATFDGTLGVTVNLGAKVDPAPALPSLDVAPYEGPAIPDDPSLVADGETLDKRNAIKRQLIKDKHGKPLSAGGNLVIIFEQDPEFAGKFTKNEMNLKIYWDGVEVENYHFSDIQRFLLLTYGLSYSISAIEFEVDSCGSRNKFHPIRDYLSSLTWDGESRISTLLTDVLHVEDCPLNRAYLSKWLTAAVKRVFEPGCKFDNMLVLIGRQGRKKGQFFEVLGGEWYGSPDSVKIADKDAKLALHHGWINEIQECDKLNSRADARDLKTLLSTREDTLRPAYGHKTGKYPRMFVMGGSANEAEGFLVDHTGGRRFWVIEVPDEDTIDIDLLKSFKDQLWAEMVALYRSGCNVWLDTDELQEAQEQSNIPYEAYDPYAELIASRKDRLDEMVRLNWFAHKFKGIGAQDIFSVLELPENLRVQGAHTIMRVLAPTLKKAGWMKEKKGPLGKQAWRWYPSDWDEIIARKGTPMFNRWETPVPASVPPITPLQTKS